MGCHRCPAHPTILTAFAKATPSCLLFSDATGRKSKKAVGRPRRHAWAGSAGVTAVSSRCPLLVLDLLLARILSSAVRAPFARRTWVTGSGSSNQKKMNSWPFCSLNGTPSCADLVLQTTCSWHQAVVSFLGVFVRVAQMDAHAACVCFSGTLFSMCACKADVGPH